MGEMVPDWAQMWGAKVKMPTDMRDDMLRDAIETCRDALDQCGDFEAEGACVLIRISPTLLPIVYTSSAGSPNQDTTLRQAP